MSNELLEAFRQTPGEEWSIIVVIHEILNYFCSVCCLNSITPKGKKKKVIKNQQKNTIKLQNVKKKFI